MTTVRIGSQLRTRGADVSLIVPDASPLQAACGKQNLPGISLEPAFKYGDLLTANRLRRVCRDRKLDIAVFFRSQDIHLGSLASLAGCRTKIVFYQQMQSGIGKKDFFHDLVYSRLSGWLTLTGIMRTEVLRHTSMSPEKVHVVPLGRDGDLFRPSAALRSSARRALRIPRHAVVVGVLGRLDRQKGQMELLEAIPAILDRIPNALFLLAGEETKNDAGMRDRLERRTEELGIRGFVRILPPTEDVPGFLAALDIFAMPSYSETYGLVLIEAMAMGLPLVATRSGGVPELVRDGTDGILVEPRNVGQLATALIALSTSPRLRKRLGSGGRSRFVSSFQDSTCVDTLVRVLSDITR